MKKILSIALPLLLALSLCACGAEPSQQDPVPSAAAAVASFDDFRTAVLAAVDTAPEMEALFPADGDLARMTRSRAACLIGLYAELNPDSGVRVYRIYGQGSLDQLQDSKILTKEEAEGMDPGVFYEALDDLQLAAVMKYFYGEETAGAVKWDDPTRIAAESGYSFFKGGSVLVSTPLQTALIPGSSDAEHDSFEFKALTVDAGKKTVTDAVGGYPAALGTSGGAFFDDTLGMAGLAAGDLGSVSVSLAGDGKAVWIGSVSRRYCGGYTITASPNLRVRAEGSTKGKVLGSLSTGTRVTVFEEKNGWGRVCYEGKTGWISLEYAELTKSPAG